MGRIISRVILFIFLATSLASSLLSENVKKKSITLRSNQPIVLEKKLKVPSLLKQNQMTLLESATESGSGSGLMDRIGIYPEHGFHGGVPEENVNTFNGNLTLKYTDISIPGPNGMNVNIYRIYNSKLYRDSHSVTPGALGSMQQDPESWVGLGWSMHMGRVHGFDPPSSEIPISIEFPDGRSEKAYLSKYGNGSSDYITEGQLKYDRYDYKLYFKDGTTWTFGEIKTLNDGSFVRVVTLIENIFGDTIEIEYQTNPSPCLKTIKQKIGSNKFRFVHFETHPDDPSPKRLYRIYYQEGVDPNNGAPTTAEFFYNVREPDLGDFKMRL